MSKKLVSLVLSALICCSLFAMPSVSAATAGTDVTPTGKTALNSGFSGTAAWYSLSGNGENDAAWVAQLAEEASPEYYLINAEVSSETSGYKDIERDGSYAVSSSTTTSGNIRRVDAENDTNKDNWYSAQTLIETIDTYTDGTRATLESSVTANRIRNNRQSNFAFNNGVDTGYGFDSEGAYYYTSATTKARPADTSKPYAYEDIVYSFASGTKISDIMFGGQYSQEYLRPSNYQIFISDDKSALFNDVNMVYHFINDNGSVNTALQHIHFETAISKKHVGIRILDPNARPMTYNAMYPCARISVLQIYGETGITVTGGTGVDNYNNAIDTTKSLILYKKPTSKIEFDAADTSDTTFYISDPNVAGFEGKGGEFSLTNVKYESRDALWGSYDVSFMEEIEGNKTIINDENRRYMQVNYALEDAAKVGKVGIYGHSSSDLTPYHFKISFANTEAELFSSTATTYDIVNEKGNHYLIIGLPKAAEAKYFGLRLIGGVMPAATGRSLALKDFYGRIGHISIEGEYQTALSKDITATSEVEGITTSVDYNGICDKNGNYTTGATATLSLDKTEITVGNTGYQFKGWYQGEKLVSEEAEYSFPLTASAQSFVAKFSSAVAKYTVSFIGRDGKIVYSTDVTSGEKVTADDLSAAQTAADGFYGYHPVGWSEDIASKVITGITTVSAVYERDSELDCNVTYAGAPVEAEGFDVKVNLTSEEEVIWYINGVKYSVGAACEFYTCGDMTVTTEILGDTDKNEPFVSIINAQAQNGNMVVFATVYEGNKTVSSLGVKFTSSVNYRIENMDWTEDVIGGLSYAEVSVEDIDIMATLTGVTAGKSRMAQAFATFSDGSAVYSKTKTATF